MIRQREARKLAIAITYTLLSACGDDGSAQHISAAPGVDGGATIVGQPGGSTMNPPGSGMQPVSPGGGPGTTTGGGNATPGGMAMGTPDAGTPIPTGPVDLGQNSQGDTFFRADTLVLKAPTIHDALLGFDVTADAQNVINDLLTKDSESDGFVDVSLLLRFLKTGSPNLGNGQVTPGGGWCPMPLGPDAACGADKSFPFQVPALAYANSAQACPLTGTPEAANAPCFSTTPASLTLQLPILGSVPLQDGQVVATWDAGNMSGGFVRGFLSKTVAATTKLGPGLPAILAVVGFKEGAELTKFLPAAEVQKNGRGEDGWWFLLSFTAKPAKFDPSREPR